MSALRCRQKGSDADGTEFNSILEFLPGASRNTESAGAHRKKSQNQTFMDESRNELVTCKQLGRVSCCASARRPQTATLLHEYSIERAYRTVPLRYTVMYRYVYGSVSRQSNLQGTGKAYSAHNFPRFRLQIPYTIGKLILRAFQRCMVRFLETKSREVVCGIRFSCRLDCLETDPYHFHFSISRARIAWAATRYRRRRVRPARAGSSRRCARGPGRRARWDQSLPR
eukprot:COSAG02_NODE_2294_length_9198_cov_3.122321_6_plen_227_part_00